MGGGLVGAVEEQIRNKSRNSCPNLVKIDGL